MIRVRENRPRVLVVDDLVDATDSLVMLLGFWGYDAEGCYAGPAALEAARVRPPRVALVDIRMPNMDGFEVAQRLREQSAMPPVVLIAISGDGHHACRRRAHEAGFDHFLVKPVELDDLRQLLIREAGPFSASRFGMVATPAILLLAVDETWSP